MIATTIPHYGIVERSKHEWRLDPGQRTCSHSNQRSPGGIIEGALTNWRTT